MIKAFQVFAAVACGFVGCACSSDDSSDDTPQNSAGESSDGSTHEPSTEPPAPLEEAKIVDTGYGFTEGPAVDKSGNVFFTDQPNDKIFKWDAETGEITDFLTGTGRANGMAFDAEGNLIACADMHGELWKIAPDGTHTVLAAGYDGKLLNGPNDVWISPTTGGIYITDPMFPRDYWDESDPRVQPWPPTHSEQAASGKGGHVYYLAPGASTLVRVTGDGWDADSWPNGVVGTPDGKKLYVNKWAADDMGGTFAFDINDDGTLSNVTQLSNMGGDGMSMDEQGNLYISNSIGIVVLSPDGLELFRIEGAGGATNNVFAGADERTLFITNIDGVATVDMNVSGIEKY
jgi:gluconolactonase